MSDLDLDAVRAREQRVVSEARPGGGDLYEALCESAGDVPALVREVERLRHLLGSQIAQLPSREDARKRAYRDRLAPIFEDDAWAFGQGIRAGVDALTDLINERAARPAEGDPPSQEKLRTELLYRLRTTAAHYRMAGKHGEPVAQGWIEAEVDKAIAALSSKGELLPHQTADNSQFVRGERLPRREQIARALFLAERGTTMRNGRAEQHWDQGHVGEDVAARYYQSADAVIALREQAIGRLA